MEDLSKEDKGTSRETLEVNTLLEITRALGSSLDIKRVFNDIMDILAFRLAMNQGVLVLRDFETGELVTEVVYGTYIQEMKGGDIPKKIFERGTPVAISSFGGPPLFLDGSVSPDIKKQDISCLCVPMKIENAVVGALVVDRLFDDSVGLNEDLRLLKSITLIIAQMIKIYRMIKKGREDLISENERLRRELEKVKGANARDGHKLKANPQKHLSVERVLEKKLDEIITVMDVTIDGKRRLYADVIAKVEKALFKLALERTNNVKYEAARFLGINRNTLHKKMKNLNLSV